MAATMEPPADRLTTQERLLLSQAVYKFGAAAWPVISKALLDHPLCQGRPRSYFEPERCEASYIALMKSIGQNVPAPDGIKPQAKPHLRLAQTFYLARLDELKRSIEAHEASFVSLMNEINSIKSGQLDATIQEELRAVLVRKHGKKKLDSWVPVPEEVKAAVEAGPTAEGESVGVPDVTQNGEIQVGESAEVPKPASVPPSIEVEALKEIATTPKQDVATPASDLSPPPSVPSTRPALHVEPAPEATLSPAPADEASPSSRPSKRKASAQPRNPPPTKRSTRRAGSPAPTGSDAASDGQPEAEAEPEEEDEDLLSAKDKRSSRRMSDKSHGARDSPKASSPASKRGGSVASNASTPAPDDRRSSRRPVGKRGMRDDVVSKSVREQSAAVSVKEEVPEDEKKGEPEEEAPSTRARRGKPDTGRSKKADTEAVDDNATTPSASVPPSAAAPSTGPRQSRSKDNKDGRVMAKSLNLLLDTISSHRDGSVFQNPVRKSDAPDYFDVIKRPMDLRTIRQRIRDGQIGTVDEFERDILLMFSNAMMYNAKGSQVYGMAQDMMKESENHIAHYRAMQQDIGR